MRPRESISHLASTGPVGGWPDFTLTLPTRTSWGELSELFMYNGNGLGTTTGAFACHEMPSRNTNVLVPMIMYTVPSGSTRNFPKASVAFTTKTITFVGAYP